MKSIYSLSKTLSLAFAALFMLLSQSAQANCNFHAGFTFTPSTANCKQINFTNTSFVTNSNDSGVSYLWYYSNSIFASTRNASYTFSANGTYTICLIMFKQTSGGICSDTACQTITINCNSGGGSGCNWGNIAWEFSKNCANKNIIFKAFNSDSTGNYKYKWSFGDGTYDSTNNMITNHTYGSVSQYTACLNIKKYVNGNLCKDTTICKTVSVTNPLRESTFSVSSGTTCNQLVFNINDSNNTNVGPCAFYRWYWGDGSTTLQTSKYGMSHNYSANGVYNVCLKTMSCADTNCYTMKCGAATVYCNTGCSFGTIAWGYSYNCATRTVSFSGNCTDTAGVKYYWSFGDQTYDTLNHRVTSHVYPNNGTYNVCFFLKKYVNGTLCKDTAICKSVTITSCSNSCSLLGEWNYNVSCPTRVATFNASVADSGGIYAYLWNYGDNSNPGSTKTATHTYAANGTYTVCLSIKRYASSNATTPCHDTTICKTITINCGSNTSCSLYGNWTYSLACPSRVASFTSFVGDTSGSYSYTWNFGDSTSNVTTKNATHTFAHNGTYTVCLKIKRYIPGTTTVCKDTMVCKTVSINCNSTCSLTGGWSYTVHCPSKEVKFNAYVGDTTGSYAYIWTFGDNTTVGATTKDPVHVYASNGTYTVCCTIKRFAANSNTVCRDTVICKSITVNCSGSTCSLQAGWSYNVSCPSRTVSFTSSVADTAGYYAYLWNFGDNTSTYAGKNATHTYASNGTYTVCLSVKRYTVSNGSTVLCKDTTICKTITINCGSCNLTANFNFGVNCALKKLEVTNTTTGDSCFISKWNFGDNTGYVVDKNPGSHTYAQAGTYNVCLIVRKCSDTTCVNYICKTIVIPPNCCNTHAYFGASINCPNKKVEVVNYSYGDSCMNYKWSWGDGTYSSAKNPGHHVYSSAGTYTICLKATKCNDTTCVNTFCKTVVIPTVCCPTPNFYFYNFCNSYRFINTTQGGTSYWWSFGDSSFSSAKNPYHSFFSKRTFQVCLTVFDSVKHCSTTVCKNVTVNCTWFGGGNHFEAPLQDRNLDDQEKAIEQNADLTPSKGLQMNPKAGISAYPNPTENILNIVFPAINSTVKITDVTGAVLMQFDNVSSFYKADVSRLAAGIYFVNVVNENGVQSVRFMKD